MLRYAVQRPTVDFSMSAIDCEMPYLGIQWRHSNPVAGLCRPMSTTTSKLAGITRISYHPERKEDLPLQHILAQSRTFSPNRYTGSEFNNLGLDLPPILRTIQRAIDDPNPFLVPSHQWPPFFDFPSLPSRDYLS